VSRHKKIKSSTGSFIALLGEALLTAGIVIAGYFAYELWGSNLEAKQEWKSSTSELQEDFADEFMEKLAANPNISPEQMELTLDLQKGEPFAIASIPKLWGSELFLPINEGVDDADLVDGLGRYPSTQLPSSAGNFAIAGHRATHGEPFANFQFLGVGDEVIVETLAGKYFYELVDDIKVLPKDVWVLESRPNIPALNALPEDARLITLTTCDPRWSSEKRWIWFGVLKSFTPRSELESGT
jgi:sortase A